MPLRVGVTFAGYRIVRQLGSGGMGEVYLVQHPRLPRQEALKVLRTDISSDPAFETGSSASRPGWRAAPVVDLDGLHPNKLSSPAGRSWVELTTLQTSSAC